MAIYNVIIISIDTLRADRLGCYGGARRLSPNMDALAGDGVLYPWAFTPATYTVPTHASMLTGLYPANHNIGFGQKTGRAEPDSAIFLQEIMREKGYATGAFVSAFVLRRQWGLDWGFDVYDDKMTSHEPNRPDQLIRDGMETTRAALDWMAGNKDGFFAFLHYFDVHGPYQREGPSKPEDYGEAPKPLDVVKDGLPGGIPAYQTLDVERTEDGSPVRWQDDMRRYLAGYDNGVAYQDTVIGELVAGLKGAGVYDSSLIILTADHGEALGEGGVYFFHGLTVTPEQARVPLILKPPAGTDMPAPCGSPVSTVDIMPTVLDMLGHDCGGLGLDGVSLLRPEPDRRVLTENEWQRAIIQGDWFLLQEKDIPSDGFCYYFDSKELCRGKRLIKYKGGRELPPDPGGPAAELIRYADALGGLVDPKERRIRDKDRAIGALEKGAREKDRTIASRDAAIARKDELIADKDRLLEGRAFKIHTLEAELASAYASKSWRLTYPLRWVSARLKGDKGGL